MNQYVIVEYTGPGRFANRVWGPYNSFEEASAVAASNQLESFSIRLVMYMEPRRDNA